MIYEQGTSTLGPAEDVMGATCVICGSHWPSLKMTSSLSDGRCSSCKQTVCENCSVSYPFCGNTICGNCNTSGSVIGIVSENNCPDCNTGPWDAYLFSLVSQRDHSNLRKVLANPLSDANVMERQCFVQVGSPPYIHKYRTLLYYAVSNGDTEAVGILLSMGASETVIASDHPDSITDLFELSLRLEPTNNQTQIIALLEDSFREKPLTGKDLFFCVRKGLVQFVVDILNREAIDPLEKNHLGFTVLQEAIFGHRLEILDLLLARGAGPYIDSDVDYLEFAVLNSLGNKVIHDMLRMGFKSHLSDSDTLPLWTNLHHAVETNDLGLVKMLIDAGSSINELRKNPTTQTPLMNAVSRSQLEMSEFLVELGADLTVRDEHGRNALGIASLGQHPGIIALLIAHGTEEGQEEDDGAGSESDQYEAMRRANDAEAEEMDADDEDQPSIDEDEEDDGAGSESDQYETANQALDAEAEEMDADDEDQPSLDEEDEDDE